MTEETFMGYRIEKLRQEPGRAGYRLHGPRVTYTLMRRVQDPTSLYVLNSRGHVANIKGMYNFTDRRGTLEKILLR